MPVLSVMASDLNIYVSMLNTKIPEANDMILLGQNSPLKPLTAMVVASMNTHDTGMPNNKNKSLYCLAHGQRMDPLI